jgi:hypothetical protein
MENSTQISIQEGDSSSDLNLHNTFCRFTKEPARLAPISGPSLTIFFGGTRLEFVPQSHIPMDALCSVRRVGRNGWARHERQSQKISRRDVIDNYFQVTTMRKKKNSMCVDEAARRAPSWKLLTAAFITAATRDTS